MNIDLNLKNRFVSIAPMMDYTDRHFRYFFRLISKYPILYTEMIPESTIFYNKNNIKKLNEFLEFNPIEHPIVCQIGGSDIEKIKEILPIIENYGYDGINLNCGCPSQKVQKGKFGAILMLEQGLLFKVIETIKKNTNLPFSIKHRLGIQTNHLTTDYNFLKEFIKNCYNSGCEHFIIHSRFAILNKDPKKNRIIPPLMYEWVYKIKQEFPNLTIELNGGIQNIKEIKFHLQFVDKVMIGRAAYYDPYSFIDCDQEFFNSQNNNKKSRIEIFRNFYPYILEQIDKGIYPHKIIPHTFGIFFDLPYSNKWKDYLNEKLLELKKFKPSEISKENLIEILEKSLNFFRNREAMEYEF